MPDIEMNQATLRLRPPIVISRDFDFTDTVEFLTHAGC